MELDIRRVGISCFDQLREFIAAYLLGCGTELPAQRHNTEHNTMWIGTVVYGRPLSEPNHVFVVFDEHKHSIVQTRFEFLNASCIMWHGWTAEPNIRLRNEW